VICGLNVILFFQFDLSLDAVVGSVEMVLSLQFATSDKS
jgi:hypothetical protein